MKRLLAGVEQGMRARLKVIGSGVIKVLV